MKTERSLQSEREMSPKRTIKENIEIGSRESLRDAWIEMQNEADCNDIKAHPLYKALMSRAQALTIGSKQKTSAKLEWPTEPIDESIFIGRPQF